MAKDSPLLAVVEDDADVRVALTRLVSSAGFAVETFASGEVFLRSVQDHETGLRRARPSHAEFDVQGALYGFVGGDISQWQPNLFRNTTAIFPFQGNPGWNLTTAMADEAIPTRQRQHRADAPTMVAPT